MRHRPDTTSFRPFERVDPEHAGPPRVAYDVKFTEHRAARAHVWSSGGYVSSTDQPMTHIGFEIRNATTRPLAFDADAMELVCAEAGSSTQSTATPHRARRQPRRRRLGAGVRASRSTYSTTTFRLPER